MTVSLVQMRGNCVKCAILASCRTQIVYATPCIVGGLLAIGEAPGRDEDLRGEGFIGASGKTLDRLLAIYGIKRSDYGRANICRCRPPENRKPTKLEVNNCLPFLAQMIVELKPKVVLLVGGTPTSIFCGPGALYEKIIAGRLVDNWSPNYSCIGAHLALRDALSYVSYVVPMPHTSPLAFNRNAPSGEKWAAIAAQQVELAVNLLHT